MIEVATDNTIVPLAPMQRNATLLLAFAESAVTGLRDINITAKGNLHQTVPWPLNANVEYVMTTVRREYPFDGDDVTEDFKFVDLKEARFSLETQPPKLLKLLRYCIEDGAVCPVIHTVLASVKEGLNIHRLDIGYGVVFTFSTPDKVHTYLHLVFGH